MRPLKRIKYFTMNSWNRSTAPAYNLKVYNVIDRDLQDKAYELIECDDLFFEINELLRDFEVENDYKWQAGFNGRSGGYLVLYKGYRKLSEHKSYCIECGQRNFKTVEETNNTVCGKCHSNTRVNHTFYDTVTCSGQGIDVKDIPVEVLKAFKRLAVNIVKTTEYLANNCEVVDHEYTVTKHCKVIQRVE